MPNFGFGLAKSQAQMGEWLLYIGMMLVQPEFWSNIT
jgi:hypothetical protein